MVNVYVAYSIGWSICFIVTGFYFLSDMEDEERARLKRKNVSPNLVVFLRAVISATCLILIARMTPDA